MPSAASRYSSLTGQDLPSMLDELVYRTLSLETCPRRRPQPWAAPKCGLKPSDQILVRLAPENSEVHTRRTKHWLDKKIMRSPMGSMCSGGGDVLVKWEEVLVDVIVQNDAVKLHPRMRFK